jgi:hypothetical protein
LKSPKQTAEINGILPMEVLRETQKKYGSRAITVAIFAGLFLIMSGHNPTGKGLILGTIFSVVNFILMGETLPMKIGKSKERIFFLSLGSILFRYIILAVPLFIAIKFDQFNLVGVIVGIFMIHLIILLDHVVTLILPSRRKPL